ncbi:MAG TPA: DUF1653 domain-containing protein [Luteibacter sp.]|nr:DUF1653 domain-containing protein [Luteibacter sp.]
MALTCGIYRHYKGNAYRVLGTARHSETMEDMVVYQALYGQFGLWVRPAAMFLESVEVDGRRVPRFAFERELAGFAATPTELPK